jgi:tetratricopeptide (TPR) repeat protein
MGPAVAAVSEDLKAEQQIKGRRLLVDNVLATVPEERRPTFDRLCLLEVPLPAEELEALLAAEGIANPAADLGWLRDHGFLARTVAPSALTGGDSVHRLLASRQQMALAEREGAGVVQGWHKRVAEHMVKRPGLLSDLGIAAWHFDAAGERAKALERYRFWANTLRDRNAYAACVQVARQGLALFPPGEDENARTQAAFLHARIHEALSGLGEIHEAEKALASGLFFLQRGIYPEAEADLRLLKGRAFVRSGRLREARDEFQAAIDRLSEREFPRERAICLTEVARLYARDDVARALKLYQEALQIFKNLGAMVERATILGDLARLRAQSGDLEGALKLYEEELKTYEELGEVRARAVRLGDIAILRMKSGDLPEAQELFREKLSIVEQLGEVGEVANAQFYLAILALQQDYQAEALERLAESWEINSRIRRADGIAFVGQLYGQLLSQTDPPRALEILRTSRDAFQLLGSTAQVTELDELIQRLEQLEQPPEPRPTLWQRLKRMLFRGERRF